MRKPGCGARKSDSGSVFFVTTVCCLSRQSGKERRRETSLPSRSAAHKGTEVGLCWMANHIFPVSAGKKRNHGYGLTGLENF